MDHEIDDALPPGPAAEVIDPPTAIAVCSVCGAEASVRFDLQIAGQPDVPGFFCAEHVPAEMREERNMMLVLSIYETIAQSSPTLAEALSVLSLALHMVAHGKELRASEVKFKQLFPHLAAGSPL